MDFTITDEQQLMLDSLREFCEREVTEEKIQKWYQDRRVDPEVCKAYLDAGFGWMFLPEEYGGIPGDAVTLALVVSELMRCTGATMPFMSYGLAMFDLAEFGSPEQVKEGMEAYAKTGEQCFSLALSEPCAGSDNMSMISTCTWNGDGTVTLNGTKTMVSHAETAPFIMFIGKDDNPDHDNKSMSMFLVPKDMPGITMAPLHKIGQTITNFDEVYFDNVVVPESMLLGKKGEGFKQLMKNFELERIMLASHSLGLAEAAVEDAARYAAQRETFGVPLYKHQIIQEMLTDMEIKVQTMRDMLLRTAWEFDQGMSVRLDSALCKRYLSRTCTEVASMAMQIFGGIGYTTECRIGRIWQDCRGDSFAGGTEEIMVHIAGRQVVKKYASDLL